MQKIYECKNVYEYRKVYECKVRKVCKCKVCKFKKSTRIHTECIQIFFDRI